MKKLALLLSVLCLSVFTLAYAEPLEMPGNPKHPAFMDAEKSIQCNYKSHILAVFNSVKCGADMEGLPERVMKAVEEYPDEVNDILCQDGLSVTVLMAGISMNEPEIVKAMLDRGAVPFAYGGKDIIEAVRFIHGNHIDIKPEIIEMINTERRKYDVYSIIIKSKS